MVDLCGARRNSADKKNRDMLQSPCGSIDMIPQNSFHRDIPELIDIETPQTLDNITLHTSTQ